MYKRQARACAGRSGAASSLAHALTRRRRCALRTLSLRANRIRDGGAAALAEAAAGARPGRECLLRLTAYVCMSPARVASAEVKTRRKIWWHSGATTSHWPDDWAVSIMPDAHDATPWRPRELRELPSAGRRPPGFFFTSRGGRRGEAAGRPRG